MRKKIITIVMIMITGLFLSSSLLFGGENYMIATESLEPLSYKKDGKIVGIATEIVEEVFRQAKVKAKIQMYPWKRAYNYALAPGNNFYFIYPILKNEKREKLFHWIGPYLWRTVALYRLKERTNIVVKNVEDMKKFKTGVTNGESMHEVLLSQGFKNGKHLQVVTNADQSLHMLFSKRIDLMYFNNFTGAWRLNKFGHSMNEVEKLLILKEGGFYIGANKGISKAVIQRLQTALDKVKKSGLFGEIVSKYLN